MTRFGVFWLPWLTTAASGSCRLKSAAAIDAEDVPVAHHADESFRLRSASTYTLTSRLSSAATKHIANHRLSGLAKADDVVGFAMAMREAPPLSLNGSLDVRRWVVEKVAGRRHCWLTWQQALLRVGRLSSSASARRR